VAYAIDPLIELLDGVSEFKDLRRVYIEYWTSNGVRMMSYHHLPPPGASDYEHDISVAAHGFPDDWVRRYVDNRWWSVDPIPAMAAESAHPKWWHEARSLDELSPEALAYLDQLDAENLGFGLAVPVYGPCGRDGYWGIGFGHERPDLTDAEVSRIHWACQIGHLCYCRLLSACPNANVRLSPRESEILDWVARGKSNAVIADIIGISANTVDTYVRRIFVKLHVSDRVTAALRGLALGLVR